MTDVPDNLVLEHLRHIRDVVDELREDVRELKHRTSSMEQQVANFAAVEASHYAGMSIRLDRLTDRIERIERRLDLVSAP
jgi:archaellum component FlaC